MALKAYALVSLSAAMAIACSRDEPLPAPARSAPWPAQAASVPSARSAPELVRFVVQPLGRAALSLATRSASPRGAFRVARGTLEVDLYDLSRSRGSVELDLGSVAMEADELELRRRYTAQALNWLDIGPSRPEAERERLRWARFTIRSISAMSASAAHEGRRIKREPAPDAAKTTDTVEGGPPPGRGPPSETRAVSLSASGELTVHGVRVDAVADLSVEFDYPEAPQPGARPTQLVIRTRRPLVVSLKTHDIKPREDTGVFVARDMKLVGTLVSPEARVELELTAKPAR